jgi:hypothetical protein
MQYSCYEEMTETEDKDGQLIYDQAIGGCGKREFPTLATIGGAVLTHSSPPYPVL